MAFAKVGGINTAHESLNYLVILNHDLIYY